MSRRAFFKAAGVSAAGAALTVSAVTNAQAQSANGETDVDAGGSEAAPLAAVAGALRKSIYLTRRNPRFTQDQFVKRWRKHGALAMSKSFFRHIVGYVQAEPIRPVPLPGVTQDYDAVAYIIVQDRTPTQLEIDELNVMVEDELETFIGPILPHILSVKETVLKKGAPGGVTAFLFFLDSAKAEPVAAHYKISAADRVILNVRQDDLTTGEMSSLIPYKAVVEVSACNLDKLKAILGPGEAAPWRSADLASITRECVMWDRLS